VKAHLTTIVAIGLASGSAFAQDLPTNHQLWPPAVFSSAYELIATEAEWKALDTLTGPARTAFLERFWIRRDPTPTTPENEFKDQFHERVEFALVWFKAVNIREPWDARGTVYIKFGDPDDRQDSVDFWYAPMDSARASGSGQDPNDFKRDYGEVWYYFGRNLVLQFQGFNLDYELVPVVNARGEYQPLFDFDERVHEVDTARTVYIPPLGRDELSLALAWYPFRREDGRYDVYLASAFPISAMVESRGRGENLLSYSASVTVRDEQMSTVWSDQVSTRKQLQGSVQGLSAQNGFSHVLSAGYYFVGGEVVSSDSVHHAAATLEGWLVPYAEKVELDLSALVIAARITDAPESGAAFVRNGKQIIPVPGAVFGAGQTIYFYHEVYNLTLAREGSCRYRIRYTLYEQKHKKERVLAEHTFEGAETQTFHSGGIPATVIKEGRYLLEARIDDLVAAKSKVALAAFKVD
jgi:GWxTD domain-containing protein